jgi:hypothetical protein
MTWQLYRVEIAGRERPVFVSAVSAAHARAEAGKSMRVPLVEVMRAEPATSRNSAEPAR